MYYTHKYIFKIISFIMYRKKKIQYFEIFIYFSFELFNNKKLNTKIQCEKKKILSRDA